MNSNQQTQGYNCNGCLEGYLRPKSFSEVKSYCLDDGRGIRMYCVLCSQCSSYQFSKRQELGLFPLLSGYFTNPINGLKEIINPEFTRYEEERTRIQQEQIRIYNQNFKSNFNCDKCSKPIPITEEKEHCFIKHFENSSVISDINWCIFCPSCASNYTRDLSNITTDPEKTNIRTSSTFEKYRERKERIKKTYPTTERREDRKLPTAQEYRKQQQERKEQEEE